MRNSAIRAKVLSILVAFFVPTAASANVGTPLPLDEYQAGTEHTNSAVVANGGFEIIAGGQPVGWTIQTPFGFGAPTGPNIEQNGAFSARGVLTFGQTGSYERSIKLLPDTNYVVSAYMWSFGSFGDEAFVEVRDALGKTTSELVLSAYLSSPDSERGVFMHQSFNSGDAEGMMVRVGAAAGPRSMPGGTVPPTLKGQIDNVAITPLAEFVPPRQIPEPLHLSLAMFTAAVFLLRPMVTPIRHR